MDSWPSHSHMLRWPRLRAVILDAFNVKYEVLSVDDALYLNGFSHESFDNLVYKWISQSFLPPVVALTWKLTGRDDDVISE